MNHIITRLYSIMICMVMIWSMQGCNKDYDVSISDKYKSDIPKNVKLLDHTNKTLTVSWDYIQGATSYVVQLLASPDETMPLYTYVTNTEDYHIFSNLAARQSYYARVRANFKNSATSDWVYVTLNNETAKIIPAYGLVAQNFEIPYFKILDSSSSTITAEWSFTGFENQDSEVSDSYSLYLYNDVDGKDLVISWEDINGLFSASTTASPKPMRFTFSGLSPDKSYYLKVIDVTQNLQSSIRKVNTTQALKAATSIAQKSGDIVLSQDFSKFIHGGDIFHKAAGYTVGTALGRSTWAPAKGLNPINEELGQATCNLNTEFNVFDGGNVTAAYTKGVGMEGWGKKGNTSTRPGYIKIGGGGALGALYTPELSSLSNSSDLTVDFRAGVYAEGSTYYCDQILIQVIRKAEFSSKGAITNSSNVEVLASRIVNIQDATEKFKDYSVTFDKVPKDARIVFSSNPDDVSSNKTRFLLDDISIKIK